MSKSYVRFWGVRGSYPAPFPTHMKIGGNTPCVEIRIDGQLYILDAGTGIIPLGNMLMQENSIRDLNVILTHYHWDHISGLPFFVPAFTKGWNIDFYAPGEDTEELEHHISQQMRAPYFPVETETWLAKITYHATRGDPIEIGPVKIRSFTLHHPGITWGYRIEVAGLTIVYAPDNELAFINESIDKRKEEFDEDERRLLEDMKEEQKHRFIEFMEDVDVLIHDAQYTPKDYARKRGWGHSCYLDTVNSAIDAGVKHLYLFSYDPNYDDDQIKELHADAKRIVKERQSKLVCHMTCEGMTIPI